MSKKKLKRKQQQKRLFPGRLVKHQNQKKVGILLKKNDLHKEYYFVSCDHKILEWHVSSIKIL